MRILQVIDNLQMYGGAQRLQILFAQAIRNTEADLTIASLHADLNSPVAGLLAGHGARVEFIPGRGLFDPWRLKRLVRLMQTEKFDVIHTHLMFSNIVGTSAAALAGIPPVASLHNERIKKRSNFAVKYFIETQLLRRVSKRVIAVGRSTANAHARRLAGQTITTIPNAVQIPEAMPPGERRIKRSEIAGDPDRPLVITVGRLTAQKGYYDLLTAWAQVIDCNPDALLLIVGQGHLHEELRRRASELALDGSVSIMGLRQDVPELLAASDIYVNSSLWEGLSVALLEAMSSGLAVVATAVGDAPYMVIDGSGYLVQPGQPEQLANSLCGLLADPDKVQRFGERARQFVLECHNPDSWSQQILDVYRQVISKDTDRSRRGAP